MERLQLPNTHHRCLNFHAYELTSTGLRPKLLALWLNRMLVRLLSFLPLRSFRVQTSQAGLKKLALATGPWARIKSGVMLEPDINPRPGIIRLAALVSLQEAASSLTPKMQKVRDRGDGCPVASCVYSLSRTG